MQNRQFHAPLSVIVTKECRPYLIFYGERVRPIPCKPSATGQPWATRQTRQGELLFHVAPWLSIGNSSLKEIAAVKVFRGCAV
jgi:hypothetical protein